MCIDFARHSNSPATSTFSRNSLEGSIRASNSGGSTTVRTRAPAAWIAICSGENSRKTQSITISAFFNASTASGIRESGVCPTAQLPIGAGAGSRMW